MKKSKAIYNVVDATKMPGETRFKRNVNAMKEAEKMAKKNPEIESTYFKFDVTGQKDDLAKDDDSSPEEYGPGQIIIA